MQGAGDGEGAEAAEAAMAEDGHSRAQLRTVQDVVQRAVREVIREPVIVVGASRTDSGVHAKAQTAAFTVSDERRAHHGPPDERLAMAINSRLPEDVLVTECRRVHDDFDPIKDCVAKGYRYSLHVSRDRPLWERKYVHHIWTELDCEAMQAGAEALVGTHDFAAFAAAGHGRETTVRTVLACRVKRPVREKVLIDVSGTGFLWNMVRIIAGTLVEVGKGRLRAEEIAGIIASRDRRNAGPTLPAQGLCLEWVHYDGDDASRLGAFGATL